MDCRLSRVAGVRSRRGQAKFVNLNVPASRKNALDLIGEANAPKILSFAKSRRVLEPYSRDSKNVTVCYYYTSSLESAFCHK